VNNNLSIEDFQARLGLKFQDEALLRRALTHRSYVNEHPLEIAEDNERLEFLGDAVIGVVVSESLYTRFPDMSEGKMTRLRAGLVRRESLAEVAREIGVGALLRLGKGEEEHGGRERDTNLCGAFEAVNGALYLDQGMDAVRVFVLPRLQERLQEMLREESDKDAKSRLQEWSQFNLNQTPSYRVLTVEGPEHARSFTIEVLIGEAVYGMGKGSSKRFAEQEAARAALETLNEEELSNLSDHEK
jgi:ribonuclease-3